MTRTRIKICGLMRPEDAAAAVAAGADAVGVVLAPSKRGVTLEQAERVLAGVPEAVARAGVFVDAPIGDVIEATRLLGLRAVQLHGAESAGYCRTVSHSAAVVKAVRVGADFDPHPLEAYRDVVAALLLDTLVPGQEGGTGQVFDWMLAAGRMPRWARVVLAGGLAPENVADAIRLMRPYAVDVSSGVEDAPGVKNRELMERFVAAVRAADQEVRDV